jgi:hypothetical protein
MTALLRLYPPAWRERYLDEITALLAERPASSRDRVDLLRGALDAWLHPQVVAATRADERQPLVRPVGTAALATLGGALWIIGGIVQHETRFDPGLGYKEASAGVPLIVAGAFVTALAAIAVAWSGPPGRTSLRRAAGAMLAFTLLLAMGWPLLLMGFFGYTVSVMAFGALLGGVARSRAGILLVPAALVVTSFNTETTMALTAVPFGLAWIAVGAAVLWRPTSTAVAAA